VFCIQIFDLNFVNNIVLTMPVIFSFGARPCAGCSSLMQARDSGFYGAQ